MANIVHQKVSGGSPEPDDPSHSLEQPDQELAVQSSQRSSYSPPPLNEWLAESIPRDPPMNPRYRPWVTLRNRSFIMSTVRFSSGVLG